MDAYLTLATPVDVEIEVRRSRFLAQLAPVSTEEQAREVIEAARARARDARHHCTAFILGPDSMTQRSNDDGEPSGTAGAPMLEVLRGRGLTDVVAIVTRWFGGILLGTGGLIRAYGDAVGAGVDAAALLRRERRLEHVVTVGHADGPRLENALRSTAGVEVVGVDYLPGGVSVRVATAPDGTEALTGTVAALTSGAGQITAGAEVWI